MAMAAIQLSSSPSSSSSAALCGKLDERPLWAASGSAAAADIAIPRRRRLSSISSSISRFALPRCTVRATAVEQMAESSQEATGETKKEKKGYEVEIKTLRDCRLGIAMYPDFVYNAEGGGGVGKGEETEGGEGEGRGGRVAVEFDPERLFIPPVQSSTTRFLGLPLPPFVCIEVLPQSLKGFIERETGKVELEFCAKFMFSIGSLYRAPPLLVDTLLTTEFTEGKLRGGQGMRMNSFGECRLVGVDRLAPIQDVLLNAFLTLPTDCLASMAATFKFSPL